MGIGGRLEAKTYFRHFNLKYDTVEIRIKCSYYSNYSARSLNIYCFQHNENEINTVEREYMIDRLTNNVYIETIDIKHYSQKLSMTIT